MKLLEHQAKERLRRVGIECPTGLLARSPQEAERAAGELGRVVVKAQVPVGGRGKAGGVKLALTPAEAHAAAAAILGMEIHGYTVPAVLCEEALEIAKEIYLGVTVDRDRQGMVVILSFAGGMEIEHVAEEHPERIAKLWPDPFAGPQAFEIRELTLRALAAVGGDTTLPKARYLAALVPVVERLFRLSQELDASLCEINPLVVTASGQVVAGDAKIEIDQNAEFRHQDLVRELGPDASAATSGDDPLEVEARRRGLTYVHLGGSVGIIGNGAGLVMNTLDLVKQHGGSAANFLDIGGGAKAEVVKRALEMLLLDPAVKGVFVNIFGGITRGDEVARGLIDARDDLGLTLPLVVRMTGTREEEGRQLLEAAGITPAVSAPEAARKIVELVAAEGGA
ncbi:MAG TPA: ADP-forming succinate--CoA ligase subunit beta [Candidatus Dormibacteraeota bacterium]